MRSVRVGVDKQNVRSDVGPLRDDKLAPALRPKGVGRGGGTRLLLLGHVLLAPGALARRRLGVLERAVRHARDELDDAGRDEVLLPRDAAACQLDAEGELGLELALDAASESNCIKQVTWLPEGNVLCCTCE